MEDYHKRVIAEKWDLDEKIERLVNFMGSPKIHDVEPVERDRLRAQLGAMSEYSAILGMRIAAFSHPEATGG